MFIGNLYIAELLGCLEENKAILIDNRIRQKYSVSNEFAILRQRDEKPEEFAEYNAFCEQVKADVNALYEVHKERASKYISGITENGRIVYRGGNYEQLE